MRLIALFSVLLLLACGCKRHSCHLLPEEGKHAHGSPPYTAAVARHLAATDQATLDCYIADYEEGSTGQYIWVDFHSSTWCATAKADITNADKLAHVKELGGVSYIAAGLDGFRVTIDSSTGNYNFIFADLDHIVD
ncbi:MAG: hypothetical protein IAE95_04915 [Chitinophagaceae bacterium]|nr:hypothetical protein [Chitinophagaceae bacterium]